MHGRFGAATAGIAERRYGHETYHTDCRRAVRPAARYRQGAVDFDIVSVEAYINDHKKQRSLLLARSTLEYSNKLLHEYSCKEVGGYKELNIDLDRYTRAFDAIDVMYQSLRTVLNVKNTYTSVSDRIGDYKSLLEDFNAKILKRGRIESADTLIISINARGLRRLPVRGNSSTSP